MNTNAPSNSSTAQQQQLLALTCLIAQPHHIYRAALTAMPCIVGGPKFYTDAILLTPTATTNRILFNTISAQLVEKLHMYIGDDVMDNDTLVSGPQSRLTLPEFMNLVNNDPNLIDLLLNNPQTLNHAANMALTAIRRVLLKRSMLFVVTLVLALSVHSITPQHHNADSITTELSHPVVMAVQVLLITVLTTALLAPPAQPERPRSRP